MTALGSFVGQLLAVFVAVGIIIGLAVMLEPRGRHVQVAAVVFVLSLVTTQLLMKVLTSPPFAFQYPALVTTLHFLTVYCICLVHWAWAGDMEKCRPMSVGSQSRYMRTILPIALSLPLSIILNNQSLIYIGAGLSAIIATFAPITTAILSHALGRKVARTAWIGIVIASVGAVIIGYGKLHGSRAVAHVDNMSLGLALSMLAVLLRSMKVVLQDKLLAPSAYSDASIPEKPLSPMHVWALQAPPCALVSSLYMIATEDVFVAVSTMTPSCFRLILLSCVSASSLNIMGMFTIRNVGASSMQIIGKVNTLIIIAVSVAFFGEELQRLVLLGALLVLTGVGIFEWASSNQASHGVLPISASSPRSIGKPSE